MAPYRRASRILTCFAVAVTLALEVCAGTGGEPARTAEIDRLIDVEMAWSGIPGMAVAVIDDGTLVHSRAYGVASVEMQAPLTTSTVVQLSSTSKAFTGVAAMVLVGDGKIALDAPVDRYLDDYPEAWPSVTVRQLLNHTSGLPEVLECGTSSREEALACVTRLSPAASPGEVFRYNQTNYFLALMLIERLGGMPFPEFMASRIFSRCGMVATSYAGSNFDVVPGRASSYYPNRAGGLRQREFDFPEYLYSAAGLNSSLEDLTRFATALTSGTILDREARDEMWRVSALIGGESSSYGLGWDLEEHGDGGRSAGHEGGRLTTIRHFIDQGITVVVLSNGFRHRFDPDGIARQAAAVFKPRLGEPTDTPRIELVARLLENDLEGALAAYTAFIADPERSTTDTEAMINDLGYRLLDRGTPSEAVAILSLNVERYPESANAHDSFGEALAAAGERTTAIEHYEESLRLDPSNSNAEEMIEKLNQ